ncbi:caveolin-3-like [Sphaeramia orbicularis]|uniref:Caveolin n=1 Tax=Sphaeramia orbicularis TaxID=375764 RepID=A0A673AJP3_9TELE|nr:caveolin-3-like [Sphaeramia orbicularis]
MEMDDENQNQEQNPLRGDPNSRDPKQINKDIQVDFEDVIAEPDGIYSVDEVWKASYFTFTGSKNCCYRFLTMMFGVPCSLMWGCIYACTSFNQIWCITPCVRFSKSGCKAMRQCFSLAFETAFDALFSPLRRLRSNLSMVLRKEN